MRDFVCNVTNYSMRKTTLQSVMKVSMMRDMEAVAKASDPRSITIHNGDARELDWIPDESVHLVVTSPPYWTLKRYPENDLQLGHIADYEQFHDELDKVWTHCLRVLVPGGRVVCVVGDVCLSRRKHGRHVVMPMHADIVVRTRRIGFDNLTPIIWHKIANASYEVENGSSFLGKPYEPNAIIKNDAEFILMLRKPGGYRQPTIQQRDSSRFTKEEHQEWFQQIWTLTGESTKEHPAPFPEKLAYRLVRMFSFTGDTVLDPFMGTGTTLIAAARCNRNAIGVELEKDYIRIARRRLDKQLSGLFSHEDPITLTDRSDSQTSQQVA
jgi:DNA modification methylase